jgi:prophage antirepressor-like protein
MEIIKAFNENGMVSNITIKGTYNNPLFRASDIGEILEISNIRQSISSFDESEKHAVSITDIIGREQQVTFLTELGLYQLLFVSRKPIAKTFKKWVCEVIKEIRLNGEYKLKKELEEISIKEKQKEIEQVIINQFPVNTECVYIGTINNTNINNEKLIKFGHTNDLSTRILDHRKNYNNFILINAFKVQNKVEIENLIKIHAKIKPQIRNIIVNDKVKKEIIAYDDINFTIDNLIKYIKEIIQSKTYSIDNFNKLLKQNEELLEENNSIKQELKENKELLIKEKITNEKLTKEIENLKKSLNLLKEEQQIDYQNILLPEDEQTNKFNKFILDMCIVRNDVEESSVNLEGQYRIWCKTKPKKEIFHAFKNYLDTRFKHVRLENQNKNQIVYGYKGVKLRDIEYVKSFVTGTNDVETFIFEVCNFTPSGKILNTTLLEEYLKWKNNLNKEITNNEIKEIKEYLNNSNYTLKSTVWTEYGSNEGYYGLILKKDEYKHKKTSSTGKQVEKREYETNILLCQWETISKASESEGISSSKMSRAIKDNIIFNDYYYCLKQ